MTPFKKWQTQKVASCKKKCPTKKGHAKKTDQQEIKQKQI